MKHLKAYENNNYKLSDKKIIADFICNITKKIFFDNNDIKPNISCWSLETDRFNLLFKVNYVDESLFKNLSIFWDTLMIKNKQIIPITNGKIGFYFSIKVTDLMEIFNNLRDFSTDKKIINKIDKLIPTVKMIEIEQYTRKYNL